MTSFHATRVQQGVRRRRALQGVGVTVALPWMESLNVFAGGDAGSGGDAAADRTDAVGQEPGTESSGK